MPDRRRNSNYIDDKDGNDVELARHNVEALFRMLRHRQSVQPRNHAEPEVQHVKSDKEEKNNARHALNGIEPVARVRIIKIVWSRFDSDHQAIDRVIDQRNKDAANLYKQDVRNRLQVLDCPIKIGRSGQSLRVSIEMLEEKNAERYNAG